MAGSAPLRVLVVEDDPAMGALVSAMLKPVSSVLQLVRSCEDALDWLATESVDAVVTDAGLADRLSSLELVRTVCALWPAVRVVVISGWVSPDIRAQARDAGAHHVLSKPFRIPEMLSALRS